MVTRGASAVRRVRRMRRVRRVMKVRRVRGMRRMRRMRRPRPPAHIVRRTMVMPVLMMMVVPPSASAIWPSPGETARKRRRRPWRHRRGMRRRMSRMMRRNGRGTWRKRGHRSRVVASPGISASPFHLPLELPLFLPLRPPLGAAFLSASPAFLSLLLLDLPPRGCQCLDLCPESLLVHLDGIVLRLGDALELRLELLDVCPGAQLVWVLGPVLEAVDV
jgi:hypothetical protein